MPGGLMNLISYGAQNIILNGNPSKTFFKATYSKYTNFGMQKFRMDYEGLRVLKYSEESKFSFTVPRYADLLNDLYVVVNLPNIWSSIYMSDTVDASLNNVRPYEFKWIEELGAHMIKEITISIGGKIIQQYSGEFISFIKERDFNNAKKDLFNKMTGNIPELNDPANSNGNVNEYPTAYWYNMGVDAVAGTAYLPEEPSIRGRQLWIPLEAWFGQTSKMAFPLVSMQYSELQIEVTFRPTFEMYMIKDVTNTNATNAELYVAPSITNDLHNIYRFLNPPRTSAPDNSGNLMSNNVYTDTRTDWNANVHLIGTYIFLDEKERRLFAQHEQKYLLRLPYEHTFLNKTSSHIIDFFSRDLVPNYMWRFRRSDAYLRNTWCNYTNYPYKYRPDLIPVKWATDASCCTFVAYYSSGDASILNEKNILLDLAIVMDGKYRENLLHSGVYNYVEKYARTTGNAKDGLYIYNFCINSNVRELQPSGAMYVNKYNHIAFEFNTITPPLDPSGNYQLLCSETGDVIGVRQEVQQLYKYTFDLKIVEERYNVLTFQGGMAGLTWTR